MSEVIEASCPYCGERVEVIIDAGGGERQEYIEDCPVCCQPWEVMIEHDHHGVWSATLLTLDD
jgi:predicted DCC family thiol-disulfide oxidoreductase YuxK